MAKAKTAKEITKKTANDHVDVADLQATPVLPEAIVTSAPEHLPRIEIVYDKADRKQPYKVMFYNCETRSVFQKMIVFTFQKALMIFRRTLIMEGEENGGK